MRAKVLKIFLLLSALSALAADPPGASEPSYESPAVVPSDYQRSVPEANDLEETIDSFGFTADESKILYQALLDLDKRSVPAYLRVGLAPAQLAQNYQPGNPLALPDALIRSWYGYLYRLQLAHENSEGVWYLDDAMIENATKFTFPGEAGKILRRFHLALTERLRRPPSYWTPRQENKIAALLLEGKIPAGPQRESVLYDFAKHAKNHPRWPALIRHFAVSSDPSERMMIYNAITWYELDTAEVRTTLQYVARHPDPEIAGWGRRSTERLDSCGPKLARIAVARK